MPKEFKAGCQRPELKMPAAKEEVAAVETQKKEEEMRMIKVGKPAPDFTAPNGLSYVSTPETLHSSELPKFRQLPKNLKSSRSSE